MLHLFLDTRVINKLNINIVLDNSWTANGIRSDCCNTSSSAGSSINLLTSAPAQAKIAWSSSPAKNISLDLDDSNLVFIISDNGQGFSMSKINNENQLGMMLIESLIEQLDGTFKIETEIGTKFLILIPFVNL